MKIEALVTLKKLPPCSPWLPELRNFYFLCGLCRTVRQCARKPVRTAHGPHGYDGRLSGLQLKVKMSVFDKNLPL
jgi:hypothetical protein